MLAATVAATVARAADPVTIAVAPLQLDQSDAGRMTIGKLIWRGGLVLQGGHADFGGYSGLKIEQGGGRLRAASAPCAEATARLCCG